MTEKKRCLLSLKLFMFIWWGMVGLDSICRKVQTYQRGNKLCSIPRSKTLDHWMGKIVHCWAVKRQREKISTRNDEAILLAIPIGVNKIPLVRCDTSHHWHNFKYTSTKLVTKSNKKKCTFSVNCLDCTNKMWYVMLQKKRENKLIK